MLIAGPFLCPEVQLCVVCAHIFISPQEREKREKNQSTKERHRKEWEEERTSRQLFGHARRKKAMGTMSKARKYLLFVLLLTLLSV